MSNADPTAEPAVHSTGGAPKAVIFDLGGVVIRICRTWAEACARAGVEVRDPERFAEFELKEQRHALTDEYQSGRIDSAAYFAGVAAATDGLYTADEVRAVHIAWVLEDYPGIARLIERLHKAGIRTACLSNTNDAHWLNVLDPDAAMGHSPATCTLGTKLVSHELGLVKPDAAIYAAALRELGMSASEVIFFDDLAENVAGARAAGWRSEQIDHTGDTSAQIEQHLIAAGLLTGETALDGTR